MTTEGEWVSKNKAALLLNCSVRKIERDMADKILRHKLQAGKRVVFVASPDKEAAPELTTTVQPAESLDEIKELRQELSAVKIAHARVLGESMVKDALIASHLETIRAKDQAINANNAAILLYESRLNAAALLIQSSKPGKYPAWNWIRKLFKML